jgi:secreted trypsin-like serine protease
VKTIAACPDPPPGSGLATNLNNICAQGDDNTGICTTDVGGPLISVDGLIGVASWGPTPCGTNDENSVNNMIKIFNKIQSKLFLHRMSLYVFRRSEIG